MHADRATLVARTMEEAVEQAERIGYPVVLKLFSETITHKTDVGGVQLNLAGRGRRARLAPHPGVRHREGRRRNIFRA